MPRVTLSQSPTRTEVARALHCSVRTVARLQKDVPIRASKPGREWILDVDDIVSWGKTQGIEVVIKDHPPELRAALEVLGLTS